MNYHFDIDIAVEYGLDESIFIQNIAFWTLINKSNNIHFYDGRYWTYNSQEAFIKLFPFWKRQAIRRVINNCKEMGLILTGNYNKSNYDRTLWYALSDKGLGITLVKNNQCINNNLGYKQPIDWLKSTNEMVEINRPIPDINTDINTDRKIKDKAQPKKQAAIEDIILPNWLPQETWEEFKQHRKEMKKPMSLLAQKKTILQLEKMKENGQDIVSIINQSIANGWRGIFDIKSQGNFYGNDQQLYGKNGNSGQKRNWNTDSWEIIKEGCGLPRDADISEIEGIISA